MTQRAPEDYPMSGPIRLGIAGLGTVGVGVVKIVQRQAALLAARCGRPIEIVAVSARSKDKDRGVNLTRYAWEDDPVALARRPDIDVFVELMGGSEGPAKDATEAAILIRQVEELVDRIRDSLPVKDSRWSAIATTHFEQGFMALQRALDPPASIVRRDATQDDMPELQAWLAR